MASKIFLDANIILDITLKRKQHMEANAVFNLVENNTVRAFITPAIIHILAYWLKKEYGKATAKELLLSLLDNVSVIDSSHEVALIALRSKIDDTEDALQYYTAIHHKIDYFISRDKDLRRSAIAELPVFTPEEFLKFAQTKK